jgi:hypothetical protein
MLFLKTWFDAAQFGFEAQSVIAMRLMKIATGGQDGAAEWTRMVLEKFDVALPREHSPSPAVKAWGLPHNWQSFQSGAACTPIICA